MPARPRHHAPGCWRPTSGPPSSTPRSCAPRRRRPPIAFLTARGFDAAAAETLRLRLRPRRAGTRSPSTCSPAGFTLDELMKAGLSKEGRRGPIDRFHRRLLWPIRDLGGDVVGFGGPPALRRRPHRGQVPQHPRDARLPQDARAVRARPGQARDRQAPPGRGRRGLHRRDGDAPRRRAHRRRLLRHGVRRRAHRRDPQADRRRLVRPRRGHLHLRRRRRGPGRRAQGVRGRAERSPPRRSSRSRPDGQDPCELRQSPGRHRGARPRGPPRAALRVRHPLDAARARPRHRRGPGRRAAAHACRWSPGSSARSCATSTPAGSRAGPAGTTSRWSCGGCGRRAGAPAERSRGRGRPGGAGTAQGRPAPAPSSARRSRRRCRCRRSPGRATTSCPSRRSPTRRSPRCTGRCRRRAGCAAAGSRPRRGSRPSRPGARRRSAGLVSELAVEPLELPRRSSTRTTRPATSRASSPGCGWRWWRPRSPSSSRGCSAPTRWRSADAYHQLFGDLVPLEQYRIALREKAMGAR